MNKWIYSSISLNLFALLGIIYTTILQIIIMLDPEEYGDILGYYWFCSGPICFCIMLLGYITEIIIYKKSPNKAFLFPYIKIKYKFLKIIYYLFFYYGLLYGAGFIVFISIIFAFITAPINNFILYNILLNNM